jgi:hypothetical protein
MPMLQGVLPSHRPVNKRRAARWCPQIGAAGTSLSKKLTANQWKLIVMEARSLRDWAERALHNRLLDRQLLLHRAAQWAL